MAEKSKYKIALVITKYVPYIIGILYFIEALLSCLHIEILYLPFIGNLTILPTICILSFSFLLKFCIWHRLPIYYAILIDVINWVDYYIHIPVNSAIMLSVYLTITIVFILLGMYFKNRYNKKLKI